MHKRILLTMTLCILLLAGCGTQENAASSIHDGSITNSGSEHSLSTATETASTTASTPTGTTPPTAAPVETAVPTAPPATATPEPYIYVEDSNIYGNTIGNIYNSGILLAEGTDAYFFDMYMGYSHRTSMSDGLSMSIHDMQMVYMNRLEDMIYCVGYSETFPNGSLIAFDTSDYHMEVLRQSSVDYLQAVNHALYYTSSENDSLCKLPLDTMEEIVLVDEPVYYPVVYKEQIIFQLDSDGEALYSISLDGGEITKLNSIHSHSPIVYKDRIYYRDEEANYSIRRMNLDGSNDEVWLSNSAGALSIWEDMLYFIDRENPSVISYVDLTAEPPTLQTLNYAAQIESALINAYGPTSVSGFKVEEYANLNFSEDYILFYCRADINGMQYTDEYIYDRKADKIIILPIFCTSLDDILDEFEDSLSNENAKQDAPVQTQQPSRSYPPGNYSVGSVYGPYLSQEELNQVADVVQEFLNNHDIANMDDYTKVSTAHDYLCDTVSYAPTWRENQANSAWGALVYHEAQCSGYARAMKALCDAMGVGCYYVHADENASNPSHQWNTVCVNGNWYIIDVQCNDDSGFRAFFLVSDDTYSSSVGMSWDRSSIPACPNDY